MEETLHDVRLWWMIFRLNLWSIDLTEQLKKKQRENKYWGRDYGEKNIVR
jgi:hypothetical protein